MGSGLGRQMGIGRSRRREQVGLGLGNGMGRLSTVFVPELGRERMNKEMAHLTSKFLG